MMDELIRIENLSITFSSRKTGEKINAVDDVSFSVNRGEVLAVVGESGSGKTTLGKAILNVIPATSGKIHYGGKVLGEISKKENALLRSKLQMIFQDPYESLDPRQNAYETLREPLKIHRPHLSRDETDALIYKYLEAVGLHPAQTMAGRYPHHLSGGQRQRLSIASTMILEPEFIVADEPVSMLDVSIRAEILKLMLELKDMSALTYLFITHDLSLAWMIADRIAVFYLGKLMEIGKADDIVHRSLHPYTNALISVIPGTRDLDVGGETYGTGAIAEPEGVFASGSEKKLKRVLVGETPAPSGFTDCCRFSSRCWLYQEKGCPEICTAEEPVLRDAIDGHSVACHFGDY